MADQYLFMIVEPDWDSDAYVGNPERIEAEFPEFASFERRAEELGARIVGACDAFDAMVSDRPYRNGMSADAAVAELGRCSGTQFDPRVVDALIHELASR